NRQRHKSPKRNPAKKWQAARARRSAWFFLHRFWAEKTQNSNVKIHCSLCVPIETSNVRRLTQLILITLRLKWAVYVYTDILGLIAAQFGDYPTKTFHHMARHFFVQFFRQHFYKQAFFFGRFWQVGKFLIVQIN